MAFIRSRPIFILLALFFAIGFTYAITTPLFEASDELWHYPMVQHLSRSFDLPVQDPNNVGPWRQEASQPPLYYYLMGWATAWIDAGDMAQTRWLNPHVDNGIITPDGNINLAIHTYAESFPWHGTTLAVRWARLLSVMIGAGTVFFTYLLASEFFESEAERLAAAAFVAFTPMFAFISGSVNNDNLASLLSAAILFLLIYLSRKSALYARQTIALGILLGLAALTKQSALGLFALAGLTIVYVGFRQTTTDDGRRTTEARRLSSVVRRLFPFVIRHLSLLYLPALAISGWWYVRNLVLYGDLLGWNAFIAVLGKRAAPASLAQLWGERFSFAKTYWGLFGGINVPMPDWVYLTLNSISLIAIVGCAFAFLRYCARSQIALCAQLPTDCSAKSAPRSPLRENGCVPSESVFPFAHPLEEKAHFPQFPHFLVLAHLALIFYGLIQWATITWSSQGRLVYSGISGIAVLFVIGMRTILPRRVRPFVLGTIALFMAAVSAAAPFAWIAPKYADPPALTAAQLAAIPNRTDVDFGAINYPAEMRLLGYQMESASATPGGSVKVTLYWQSLVGMDRDWSVFVHLVDENQIVVAQRDTYPGLGLMPTRKWAVGRTVADTYVITLPPTVYAPSDARVEVGLYDYNTGERLPVVNGDQAGNEALTLSPFLIVPNTGGLPNPLAVNFGNQVELAGYNMDRRAVAAGDSITLTLYWRGLRPIKTNYSAFAHVRGQGESLWAQSDSWPQDGAAPTAAWTPGQLVEDTRALTLKPDTAPGVYDVEIGLYDERGNRLQIVLPDGRRTDNFVYLSKIRVLP